MKLFKIFFSSIAKQCATLPLFRLQFLYKTVIILIVIFISGCVSYKTPISSFMNTQVNDADQFLGMTSEQKQSVGDHWLYKIVPRHRCQIHWYDAAHWSTWMLFGNDDDGIFGEGDSAKYHLEDNNDVYKAMRWWCRNPLHNFCFYVIGTAYCHNSEFIILEVTGEGISGFKYKREGTTNFPREGSCFYIAFHGWKPFVSLRLVHTWERRSDFYIGWRCRGNFGIKCTPFTSHS